MELIPQAKLGSFGVEAGDPLAEMGEVTDVAVLEGGPIFLLDRTTGRIRVLTQSGQYLTGFGRPGEGPGEFKHAVALAIHRATRALYVLDQGMARVARLLWDGTSLLWAGSFPVTHSAVDLCALDNELFLYTPSQAGGPVLIVLSLHGKELRSFGTPFGDEGGMMTRMAHRGGVLACLPKAETIVLSARLHPEIRAYRPDGTLRWRLDALPGFRPVVISILPRGFRVDHERTPQPWDRIEALFFVESSVLGVQAERRKRPAPANGSDGFERRTFYFDLVSGAPLGTQKDLPRLAGIRGGVGVGTSDDPFPKAEIISYRMNGIGPTRRGS